MYQEHFGLTRELFRSDSEGESIYVGPQQLATIAKLRKALATPDAIITVTGPVGVGKSAIAGRALQEIAPERMIARIGRMRLGPDEVLELLLESFSITRQPAGTIQRFAAFKRLLRDFAAKGTRPFIVIEDARRIGTDALLEIEALTAADTAGAAAANIVLLGDSELDTLLADPGLARMKQRIRLRHTVTPFTDSDTEDYLRHCVSVAGGDFGNIFASGTVAALHACAGGIPRVLNNICESVLTEAADRGERPVTAALVSSVASDVYGIEVMPGFAGSSADEQETKNTDNDNDADIGGMALAAIGPAGGDDAFSDAAPDARTAGSDEEPVETNTATVEPDSVMDEAVQAEGAQPIPDSADKADRTEIAHEPADAPVDELAERRPAAPSQPACSHQDLPELGELLARIGVTRPKSDTLVAEEFLADDDMPGPVNFAEQETLFESDIDEETVSPDVTIEAVTDATPASDDDMQEPLYVADDDDTLEAPILDEQEIPSIDEALAAPEKQERDWSASDDDIPVLTAEMHVAAANDEENAISLADTSGDPESDEDAGDAMPHFAVADIDELELALAVTHDVIEESPDASQDNAHPEGELPEITLDDELDKKKAPAPVTNLSRWQEELALANGLEDISDVLAETVFGDKAFDELAAQIAFNPDPDQLDGLALAEESTPAAPVRSAAVPAPQTPSTTAGQQDRSGAWKFDMSVSRRFELVKELGRAQREREINAHNMVEITLGEDGCPVDASQGPVPEPIEVQINTEITQSRMALKPDDIEKMAAKEETPPEPEKESRGLFGLFRRSSKS